MNQYRYRIYAGLAGALLASPALTAPASNWATTTTTSADGGYVLGNPAAATKVVEYASYTCSHCANFERDGVPLVKRDYIPKGTVSFEVRNLARDPLDLTVAVLARCGGSARFFGNHKYFMATQTKWMAKGRLITKATEAKLAKEDYTGFVLGAYVDMGLSAYAKQRGITDNQARACMADRSAIDKILAMTEKALGPLGLQATPAFLVNGRAQSDIFDFATLKPYLPK